MTSEATSEALLRMTKFSARTLSNADLDEHSDLLDAILAAVRSENDRRSESPSFYPPVDTATYPPIFSLIAQLKDDHP